MTRKANPIGTPQRHGGTLLPVPGGRMIVVESRDDPTAGVIVKPEALAGLAVSRRSVQTSYWRRAR